MTTTPELSNKLAVRGSISCIVIPLGCLLRTPARRDNPVSTLRHRPGNSTWESEGGALRLRSPPLPSSRLCKASMGNGSTSKPKAKNALGLCEALA
ncbi:hypothetical protein CKAH01_05541 [Colletotrichum kahawae]|uniref:Uncharacterized protein n=1 Tax=Colletotrichum kahawae TaxID=34407 RepID=A0AAD9YEB5_COLKA|nr:hypothetical protein CKAH01_05541 [Colletotrichum kahawae]